MLSRIALVAAVAWAGANAQLPTGGSPAGCAATTCAVGWTCVEENGVARCVDTSANPCAAVTCREGSQCVSLGGLGLCLPWWVKPRGCAVLQCREGYECREVFGWGYCRRAAGTPAPAPPVVGCDVIRCASGTHCLEDHEGRGACVPATAPCAATTCAPGYSCVEEVPGVGKCVKEPVICCLAYPSCGEKFEEVPATACTDADFTAGTCKTETLCCSTITCKARKIDELPAPPATSCAAVTCLTGTVCRIENGVAKCL